LKSHVINQSPFYCLNSKKKLAQILGDELRSISSLVKLDRKYREKCISLNGRKPRLVQEPVLELKNVQARIHDLLIRIELPDYVFSPARGRSYIDNARFHIGQPVVRQLDITNFFPSTPAQRVTQFFKQKLRCSPDVSWLLTELVTYEKRLPTGAPSSPIIAYYSYCDLWQDIANVLAISRCRFSIYVDDITVSGENVPDRLIWEVKKMIHEAGLKYHKEKHYRHGFSEVTGVIVKEGGLSLPHRIHERTYKAQKDLSSAPDSERAIFGARLQAYQGQLKHILSKG
jgi:retron-type reverse transcriptase